MHSMRKRGVRNGVTSQVTSAMPQWRSEMESQESRESRESAAPTTPALASVPGVTLAWRAWVAQFPPEARLLLDLLIEVNCRLAREKAARLQAQQTQVA
jgi:hypothetical protein